MSESIINFFSNIFSPELCTFIISMIPIVELRGAIPLAMLAWGMPWYEAFIISVVGNIIPIPFIIWFIRPVFNWLKRFKIFKKFVSWQERKVEKSSDKVMKNVKRGLFAFVAIETVAISDSDIVVPLLVMIGTFCRSIRFVGFDEADALILCAPCSTLPIGIVKSVVVM